MKHSILGFQQDKLIKNNLTVEDALILRQIKDMYSTASMEFVIEDDIKYMWINYTYLNDQLPIIGSKRNLMRKIEYYGDELFILRILRHSKNGKKGNFSYIAPTVKMDTLQDFDLMTESHKGYDRNDIRVMTESHNKDTSLRDTSLRDNKSLKHMSEQSNEIINLSEYEQVLNEFRKFRKKIKAPLSEYAEKLLLTKLEKLSNNDETVKICILQQSIMNGWKGVFDLKKDNQGQYKGTRQDQVQNAAKTYMEMLEREDDDDCNQEPEEGYIVVD